MSSPAPSVAAESLAGRVVSALSAAAATLGCAESLTAGLLAATVAEVPGASAVLRGGVVAYATDLKASVLGVPRAVLAAHGAVSGPCAEAMAAGAVRVCGSTYGLALTGVAGPEPQEGHPPGHVWLGLAGPDGASARLLTLAGDRATVRAGAVEAALGALLAHLAGGAH